MQRTSKTWTICAIVVAGLIAANLFHWYAASVLGYGFPGNTFTFDPDIRFSDFYLIFEPIKVGHPLAARVSVYFPFAYVPLYPLIGLPWEVAYAIVLLIFSCSVFYVFWRRLDFLPGWQRVVAAATIPFASFAVLISIDRGNIELILIVFVLAFFGLWERGKYLWSALPLAAAIAMKIYPGAFGVLLLLRKQYAAALLTGVLTVIFTIASSAAYPGGISKTVELLQLRLAWFDNWYISNPLADYGSTGYFTALKLITRQAGIDFSLIREPFMTVYNLAALALFLTVLAYIFLRERTVWKQVYLLSFLIIVLPHVSFDYKLAHLLLPIALFLAAPPAKRGHDYLYAILFGLILVPKAYWPLGAHTTIGVLLSPLMLTVIAVHIMATGWRRPVTAQPQDFGRA